MRDYTVYKHIFPNGKVYIGITSQKNLNRRWDNGRGYSTQALMSKAINKYGWENVIHLTIASGLTKQQAEEMEMALISAEKSNDPAYGYNIENGGNCMGTHSEETKRKISAAQIGSKNHNYGKPSPLRGKKQPPEIVEKNRIAHLGQPSYWKGKHLPEEMRAKLKKPKTVEHKQKISAAKSVSVVCVETGEIFKSMKEAGIAKGIPRGSISYVVRGDRHTAGGLHWKYANEV